MKTTVNKSSIGSKGLMREEKRIEEKISKALIRIAHEKSIPRIKKHWPTYHYGALAIICPRFTKRHLGMLVSKIKKSIGGELEHVNRLLYDAQKVVNENNTRWATFLAQESLELGAECPPQIGETEFPDICRKIQERLERIKYVQKEIEPLKYFHFPIHTDVRILVDRYHQFIGTYRLRKYINNLTRIYNPM